jgi:two-component system nitrogen regulation response regulator GlnG
MQIPRLAERREDIRSLAEHFVARYADELSDGDPFLPANTIAFLSDYDWPGNVRELENAIKRALVLASGDVLQPDDFAFLHSEAPADGPSGDLAILVEEDVRGSLEGPETGDIYRGIIERVEVPLIEAVLDHTDGNQIRAAALLGINRNTLRKKISDLGIHLTKRK